MGSMNDFAPFIKKYGCFTVKNIAIEPKTIKIFNYPIPHLKSRDLLAIRGVSESDIRASLLKGELRHKILAKDILVECSDIDLLQFNLDQKLFLQNSGVVNGLEITPSLIGALTAEQHKTLRQLIHLADGMNGPMEGFTSGAFRETLPLNDPFPTSIIWWESSAKLEKIVDKTIVYDGSKRPTTITSKVYDENGILLATVSDTITYTGTSPFETSRLRTVS